MLVVSTGGEGDLGQRVVVLSAGQGGVQHQYVALQSERGGVVKQLYCPASMGLEPGKTYRNFSE